MNTMNIIKMQKGVMRQLRRPGLAPGGAPPLTLQKGVTKPAWNPPPAHHQPSRVGMEDAIQDADEQMLILNDFKAQLKSLCMGIHKTQAKVESWETLDVKLRKTQEFNVQKATLKKACDITNKGVRELLDKVQNHQRANLALQQELQELQTDLQLGESLRQEEMTLRAAVDEEHRLTEALKDKIRVIRQELVEVERCRGVGSKLQAQLDSLMSEKLALQQSFQVLQEDVQPGHSIRQENETLRALIDEEHRLIEALKEELRVIRQEFVEVERCRTVGSELQAQLNTLTSDKLQLQQLVQKLQEDVQLGDAVRRENMTVSALVDEEHRLIEALKEELCVIRQKVVEVEHCRTVGRELQAHLDSLTRENGALQESIQAANKEFAIADGFKRSFIACKDREQTLQRENEELVSTHREVLLKLLVQEDFKSRHDLLKTKIDSLKEQQASYNETVLTLKARLDELVTLKNNYKAMKIEKDGIKRQNTSLAKDIQVLEKKIARTKKYNQK